MSSGFIETGLTKETLDIHRALASLQEELEAIDYYHQRVDTTSDESLKAVLAHNRDDEMEHAMMLLEWLRRTMPGFDVQMKKLLFTSGDLTVLAKAVKPPVANGSGLGLGNLK
jgi:ferritin-like protein